MSESEDRNKSTWSRSTVSVGCSPLGWRAPSSLRRPLRHPRRVYSALKPSQEIFHPRPTGVSSYFRRLWRAAKANRESFVDANFGRRRTETHQQVARILVLNILDPVQKTICAKARFNVIRHARTWRQGIRARGNQQHRSMNMLDFDGRRVANVGRPVENVRKLAHRRGAIVNSLGVGQRCAVERPRRVAASHRTPSQLLWRVGDDAGDVRPQGADHQRQFRPTRFAHHGDAVGTDFWTSLQPIERLEYVFQRHPAKLRLFELGRMTFAVAKIGERQHRIAGPREITRGSLIGIAALRTAKHQDAGSPRSPGRGIEMPDQAGFAHVNALDVLRLRVMTCSKNDNQNTR